MFGNWIKKYKAPEEKQLQLYMDNDQINIKLMELSKLTPLQYYAKFKEAYDEYMNHRTSFGRFSEKLGNRPYITNMMDRLNHNQMKERDQEVLLLLNEAGQGVNKKSLNFHVLAKMFDLNHPEFSDETAAKLINDTQSILLLRYPDIKPEAGSRQYAHRIG
jgi:hypothetical protein